MGKYSDSDAGSSEGDADGGLDDSSSFVFDPDADVMELGLDEDSMSQRSAQSPAAMNHSKERRRSSRRQSTSSRRSSLGAKNGSTSNVDQEFVSTREWTDDLAPSGNDPQQQAEGSRSTSISGREGSGSGSNPFNWDPNYGDYNYDASAMDTSVGDDGSRRYSYGWKEDAQYDDFDYTAGVYEDADGQPDDILGAYYRRASVASQLMAKSSHSTRTENSSSGQPVDSDGGGSDEVGRRGSRSLSVSKLDDVEAFDDLDFSARSPNAGSPLAAMDPSVLAASLGKGGFAEGSTLMSTSTEGHSRSGIEPFSDLDWNSPRGNSQRPGSGSGSLRKSNQSPRLGNQNVRFSLSEGQSQDSRHLPMTKKLSGSGSISPGAGSRPSELPPRNPNPPLGRVATKERLPPRSFRRRSSLGFTRRGSTGSGPGLFPSATMQPFAESYYITFYKAFNQPVEVPKSYHPPHARRIETVSLVGNVLFRFLKWNDVTTVELLAEEQRGWSAIMTVLAIEEVTGDVEPDAVRKSTQEKRVLQSDESAWRRDIEFMAQAHLAKECYEPFRRGFLILFESHQRHGMLMQHVKSTAIFVTGATFAVSVTGGSSDDGDDEANTSAPLDRTVDSIQLPSAIQPRKPSQSWVSQPSSARTRSLLGTAVRDDQSEELRRAKSLSPLTSRGNTSGVVVCPSDSARNIACSEEVILTKKLSACLDRFDKWCVGTGQRTGYSVTTPTRGYSNLDLPKEGFASPRLRNTPRSSPQLRRGGHALGSPKPARLPPLNSTVHQQRENETWW